jgi:iron complex outermembrane receptor protein
MKTKNLRAACLAAAIGGAHAWAAPEPTRLAELADLSLEQLTKITVTSASRREEALVEAPASLYVITADDIRRSGALTIPEALRLAPNLHVARGDSSQYVVAARGFSDVLTNKLLVLIDGRTVYTPLFSGVFWEAQDAFLADIDRIEVISGPGATLWGANAVNGVINIITKAASDTQGTYARAGAGGDDRIAALRYGGALPNDGHYRVFAKYSARDAFDAVTGPIGDDATQVSGGFRADWRSAALESTLQADAYRGEVDAGPMREFSGVSLRARVERQLDAGSQLALQAYYDRTHRRHESSFEETLDTFDLEAQLSCKPWAGHMLVVGGGYRHSRDDVTNSAAQAFIPEDRTLGWGNAFVQDELALGGGLSAIFGLKVESNPYTGSEWLPNLRLAWLRNDTLVWGAVSRGVRAPARIDRELFFPGAPPYLLTGANAFESEIANVAELGYRTQASAALSFSATGYHHRYPNLRSVGLVDGRPAFRNDIEGRVSGIEAWGTYRLSPALRVTAGIVAQDISMHVKPGAIDLGGLASLGNSPERMAQVRFSWSPTADVDFDWFTRYVGKLQSVVPAYSATDLRLAWRPTRPIELSLVLRNAFDGEHVEWQNRGLVPRSFFLHLRWQS